jgi:hypothetical protein
MSAAGRGPLGGNIWTRLLRIALDQVTVRETQKWLKFDGVTVEPMGGEDGRQEPYRQNGKMRRYRLDPDAPSNSPSMAKNLPNNICSMRSLSPQAGFDHQAWNLLSCRSMN